MTNMSDTTSARQGISPKPVILLKGMQPLCDQDQDKGAREEIAHPHGMHQRFEDLKFK